MSQKGGRPALARTIHSLIWGGVAEMHFPLALPSYLTFLGAGCERPSVPQGVIIPHLTQIRFSNVHVPCHISGRMPSPGCARWRPLSCVAVVELEWCGYTALLRSLRGWRHVTMGHFGEREFHV